MTFPDKRPTHVSLFSGIGGFDLAADWAGFRTIAFSEIDPYANAILKKHWPDVPNYRDIHNVPAIPCDLLTGGPPCQPFSIAGRRYGAKDHRDLWPAMLAAIQRCKPAFIVVENVVNAANMVLARWIDDLEVLGYSTAALDIPSCAVGLPSVERHIWLVAAHRGIKFQRCCKEHVPRITSLESLVCERWPAYYGAEGTSGRSDLPNPATMRSRKGIPHYVDRIRSIGNAVPPQVAYQILKPIADCLQSQLW